MLHQVSTCGAAVAGLWAITTYFNPIGYRRRLSNYRTFRQHLGVPLLTVELAFGADFELRPGDADCLIQRRGRDVMWHKERLLNVALAHLPDACRKVIWLDCDLIYTRPDWPADVIRLLDEYPLIQGFRRARHLRPDAPVERVGPGDVIREALSLASAVATRAATLDDLNRIAPRESEQFSPGFAWAGHREVIERFGLYDACIVGGGDSAFVCAAYGRFEGERSSHFLGARRAQHYVHWAEPVFRAIGGRVGFLDADVLHQWHGDLAKRGSPQRHKRLAEFEFDPFTDIILDPAGCWRWNSRKPAMHAWVRSYFESRKEDG